MADTFTAEGEGTDSCVIRPLRRSSSCNRLERHADDSECDLGGWIRPPGEGGEEADAADEDVADASAIRGFVC